MDLRPLSRDFGAEVIGISLADVAAPGARGDQAYASVRAAFEERSVLLFRNQHHINVDELNSLKG
jgi:alpha-ketoglutarate-dependent taurine dioxygenase